MNKEPITRAKAFRVIACLLVALVCGLTFGLTIQGIVISMAQDAVLGARDFVVFWATGEQLARHANPYDPVALLQIERAAGLPAMYGVMYMRNLPFALPLVYPLGFLSLRMASIVWSALLFICLAASVRLLWVMHGRAKNERHWIGYSFGPALISIIMGQSTLFALLGLVLFLRWHRARPFCAGLALWLCMLKPHLFLPFGVALLVWIAVTRSYKILAGAATALAASLCVTYFVDPAAWSQYAAMAGRSGIQTEFIPCLSVVLREWLGNDSLGLQYLPAFLACAWSVRYFWKRRFVWDWTKREGSLLLLISLVAAPYAWIYDAGIAIPALLQGAYATRSKSALAALALLSVLIEVALFGNLLKPAAIHNWTIWSAPAWLAWYLIASAPPAAWGSVRTFLTDRKRRLASAAEKEFLNDPIAQAK